MRNLHEHWDVVGARSRGAQRGVQVVDELPMLWWHSVILPRNGDALPSPRKDRARLADSGAPALCVGVMPYALRLPAELRE